MRKSTEAGIMLSMDACPFARDAVLSHLPDMKTPHLLALGYGYVARHLSEQLIREGWAVTGTTRSPDRASTLAGEGVQGMAWTAGNPPVQDLKDAVAAATHILVSIPPDQEGDPTLRSLGITVQSAAEGGLRWVGLLSTTGVYGDRQGGWVDEATTPEPGLDRTRRRLAAEDAWQECLQDSGAALQIFRLSGIYGPGRSVFDRIRAGTARRIVKEGGVFNRIHVDDIVSALRLGMASDVEGVFNVSDDLPAPADAVLVHACRLLDVEPPPPIPLDEAHLSAMGRSFYQEDRRVRATRLKEVLGWKPGYPSYREGLLALLMP